MNGSTDQIPERRQESGEEDPEEVVVGEGPEKFAQGRDSETGHDRHDPGHQCHPSDSPGDEAE